MALPGFQCLSLELPPSCVGTSKHRKGLWSYSSPIEDSTRSLLFAPIRTSNGTAKGADSQNSPLVSLTLHLVRWGGGEAKLKGSNFVAVARMQFLLVLGNLCVGFSSSSADCLHHLLLLSSHSLPPQ